MPNPQKPLSSHVHGRKGAKDPGKFVFTKGRSQSRATEAQREANNDMSLSGAVEIVEKLVDTLSPMIGQAQTQRGSLLSEVDGMLQELMLSRDEIKKLQMHITLIEENLRDECEARTKTNVALAEATHRVNELQGAVQEFHKDLMGKQRLIAYLEEQHSSLHGSLTAHQVNLKEKERQLQSMDVSWLQDKSQLMRKETELEYFQRCLHEAQEYNDLVTDMVVGLERDVLGLCAIVEGAALRGNEFVSLREDRQTLKETQKLLEQDQSKVAVFSEVLANLQENHRNLEAAQCDTIQELEDVSKDADLLKDTAERQAVEIELLTKRLAFSTERGDFYTSEVEAKVELLDRGLNQVTEMVTMACTQIQDLPELRSTRKIARELEMLLRSTEQSLMSERTWSQGKGAEVKRMENCIQELESRLADKSLHAEKLDKHVQQLSGMVSTLQHDLLEIQTVMKAQNKDTFQATGQLMEAEAQIVEIFSKMSQAKHFQDD